MSERLLCAGYARRFEPSESGRAAMVSQHEPHDAMNPAGVCNQL